MAELEERKKIGIIFIMVGILLFLFALTKQISVFIDKDFNYITFITNNILFFSPIFLFSIVLIGLGQFFLNPAKFVQETEKTKLKSKGDKVILFIVGVFIIITLSAAKVSIGNRFSPEDILWGVKTLIRFFFLPILLPIFFWVIGSIVTAQNTQKI